MNPGRSFKANLLWRKEWRWEKSRQQLSVCVREGNLSLSLFLPLFFKVTCVVVAEKAYRLFDPSMLSSLWTRLTKQPNLTENEKWQKVSPSRCFLSVQTPWWDDHAWSVIFYKCVLLHKCVQECAMAFMCQQTHFHWKKCFSWKVSQWSSE